MNKKTISAGILASMALSTVLFTSSASAFWPFDGLFNKGEVKAAVTEKKISIKTDRSEATKLSAALNTMKTLCTDLFKTPTTTNNEDAKVYKNENTGVVKPGEQNMLKNDANRNNVNSQMEKKIVTETSSIMALMKNVCRQITGYNERFDKVYKTAVSETITPTATPSESKNPEKKPFIKFFEGDSNKKQAR